jgi:diguanylate cyclase (GGDEF)-like protein/PAS domain S-box-containing protein
VAWQAGALEHLTSSTDLHCILDDDMSISWAAGAWAAILGKAPGELVGQPLNQLLHPADRTALLEALRAADGSPHEYLARARCGPAAYRWLGWNGRPGDHGSGVVAIARDVTSRVNAHSELLDDLEAARRSATHDPLTGLANTVLLREHLALTLARSARTDLPPLVLFIDLNGFETVNDVLGHQAGDEALRIIAGRLSEVFRPSDLIARIGGDEFVVVLENANPTAVRDRLRGAIEKPFDLGSHTIRLSAAVGIAILTDPTITPEQAIDSADQQIYMARASAGDEPGVLVSPRND